MSKTKNKTKKNKRSTVYNKFFTQELWDKVNPVNKQLFKQWQQYLVAEGKSKGTIKQYKNNFRIICIVILKECDNYAITDLNPRHIIALQSYFLDECNHSPNRVRSMRSCLSSFSEWIEIIMDDLYPEFKNIVNRIKAPPKAEVREKIILSEKEVSKVLEKLYQTEQYQKACVFALAANSGARLSELLRFKVSYFDKENIRDNAYYITPEKIKTKGDGQYGKMLHKYVLINGFQKYLDAWLKERELLQVDNEYLFVTKDNDNEWVCAKDSTLQSWTNTYSKILNKSFYFHSLRHYLTTKLRKNRIPDKVIQSFFGWSSPDMINIYDDSQASDEFGQYFSESGIVEQSTGNLK